MLLVAAGPISPQTDRLAPRLSANRHLSYVDSFLSFSAKLSAVVCFFIKEQRACLSVLCLHSYSVCFTVFLEITAKQPLFILLLYRFHNADGPLTAVK